VTAVHAYEDCSLLPFKEAKRLGKACVYDLTSPFYSTWQRHQLELSHRYSDWLPFGGFGANDAVSLEQKHREMEFADLVLVASLFVEGTVRETFPHKNIAIIPYGVDLDFWTPRPVDEPRGPLRFIYAGQISVRKGAPLLVEAWEKASLKDAELHLVGSWELAEAKRRSLPRGVRWFPACPSQALRERYRDSDIFVFPSFSDGFGLVLLEAMACGLPTIASVASGGPDIITRSCGRVFPAGDVDCLVGLLRWFDRNRGDIPDMARAAREEAERWTWSSYRDGLRRAVSKLMFSPSRRCEEHPALA
jgi:glycosyltransferase involved in cell wall biosynthesis